MMTPAPPRDTLLTNLVEAAPDAMFVVSALGHIMIANRQAEILFGYSREEMIDHPIEMLVPKRYAHTHVLDRTKYAETPGRLRPWSVA